MPNEVKNVTAGKPMSTGGLLVAPIATALPTDETTALNAAFKSVGYIGEDGVTEATERSTEKVRAWGGDTVKVLQTDFSVTYQLTLIESMNTDVLKTVYGDANVVTTAATASVGKKEAVKVNADQLPHKRFIFEVKDGDARIRIVVPDGQVTEVGEITYSDGEVIGHQITVEAYKDAAQNANAIKYLNDGRTT